MRKTDMFSRTEGNKHKEGYVATCRTSVGKTEPQCLHTLPVGRSTRPTSECTLLHKSWVFQFSFDVCHGKWLLGASPGQWRWCPGMRGHSCHGCIPGSTGQRAGLSGGSMCPLAVPLAVPNSPYSGQDQGLPRSLSSTGRTYKFRAGQLPRSPWCLQVQILILIVQITAASTARGRDAGASLPPGGAEGMVLGVNSFPLRSTDLAVYSQDISYPVICLHEKRNWGSGISVLWLCL